MSFRGGGGGQGAGGRGRGRAKNRPTPYGIGKDGKGPSWRDRGGNNRGQEEGPEQREFQVPPADSSLDMSGEGPQAPTQGEELTRPPPPPKKFTNKARLFFGNLPRDFTEEELKTILAAHGEVQEIYHNKEKNFAFARMAYRSEAEKVIAHHNGQTIRNRDIKVRFAASSASVKVSNLNPTVSNELLAEAFAQFGDVEEAVVATDDRGKPLGYGIVDFARKGQAMSAIQQCRNDPFLLTKTPVPVVVAEMVRDNEDGLPEKQLPKNNVYHFEREAPPRFPQPGSLEYDVAMRWKAFFDQEKTERAELEEKIKAMKASIQKDMDTIKEQHQTLMLRQEIARHQLEQQRLAERLREQEERLKGLNAAQNAAGLMPMFAQMPPPLFPPIMSTDTSRSEVPSSQPPDVPPTADYSMAPMPPMPPGAPLFMTPPPPLMGQKPH